MEQNWLNKVLFDLCEKCVDIVGDNATYLGFEVEPESDPYLKGLNSTQIYGSIIYKNEHGITLRSKPLFIKRAAKLWNRKLTISFSFINELNVYTKIVPVLSTLDSKFSSLFAKFHHGEVIFNVEEDQSVIVLENLRTRGYRMSEKSSFLSYEHLMLMMRKIGEFHAYSYKAKTSIPDLFYPLANNLLETHPEVNKESFKIYGNCGQRGFECLMRDPAYVKYESKIRRMLENAHDIYIEAMTGDKNNPFSVIAHGDYLRNNVMFRYDNGIPNDLVIVDVATFRYGSPVIDLATVLYLNADQEMRDKYWDCLIDGYYTALKETFPKNEIPTKNEILMEFVDKSFFGYLLVSLFLPIVIVWDIRDVPGQKVSTFQNNEHTRESIIEMCLKNGGMKTTQALCDVLKDMIDRGFICK